MAKSNGAAADIASQLAELAKLMEKGLLSSDEFKRAKGVIMAKADGSTKGVAAAGGLAALV